MRRASGIPVIRIPAKSVPDGILDPCTVINKMPMCKRCVEKCELKDFLVDEVIARVVSGTKKNQPVDLSRAYMDRMILNESQLTELMKGA